MTTQKRSAVIYVFIAFNKPTDQASKEMITATAFAEMDKDEDGKITTEEFIAACMGQEEFSKMITLKIINIFIEDDK
jgi:Ca2+-binding EF-hand superfamily protein